MRKTYRYGASNRQKTRSTCWLLTWNPRLFIWEELGDRISELNRAGVVHSDWSCANNRSIEPLDRLFLMRLGQDRPGIVGSGSAESEPYLGPHWDEDLASRGVQVRYVKIAFDVLLDPDERIFPKSKLIREVSDRMRWTPRQSGISIPLDVASRLEAAWAEFLQQPR